MKKKFILKHAYLKKNYLKDILVWFEQQIQLIFPEKSTQWIPVLCFEEFVTNVFLYSNLPFPSYFLVQILLVNNQLMIEVVDEGDFYDINSHPVVMENRIGGCGIRLIKAYMNVQQSNNKRKNITRLSLSI